MQDIKQQEEMNKRFDVMIDNIYEFGNYDKNLNPYLKSFIQSEISLAVEQERERIKESVMFNVISNKNGEYINLGTLLSIITTKE